MGTYNNFNTVGSDPSQFTVDKVLLSLINDETKKEVFSKEITVEKFSDTYLIFPTTPEFEITPIPSSIPSTGINGKKN